MYVVNLLFFCWYVAGYSYTNSSYIVDENITTYIELHVDAPQFLSKLIILNVLLCASILIAFYKMLIFCLSMSNDACHLIANGNIFNHTVDTVSKFLGTIAVFIITFPLIVVFIVFLCFVHVITQLNSLHEMFIPEVLSVLNSTLNSTVQQSLCLHP